MRQYVVDLEKRTRGIWSTTDTYLAIQLKFEQSIQFQKKSKLLHRRHGNLFFSICFSFSG